jgi:predicted RNase H-like nuclease (RuvC/YqgF family)
MTNTIDSYHLIQFVLQSASHNNTTDWSAFMVQLVKIYKGHVSDKLLQGLIRKNIPELSSECNAQLKKNQEIVRRRQALEEEHALKVQKWFERREKGNSEAWERIWEHRKMMEIHGSTYVE